MKYPRDTYLRFNIFCKTVLLETKKKLDAANLGTMWGTILLIIARIITFGIPAFISLNILISGGAVTYFGSIGTLIYSNPVLAGILIAGTGLGLAQIIGMIWKKRQVFEVVKETLIDRYKGDFDFHLTKLNSKDPLDPTHIAAIEELARKAVIDLLNALVKIGEIRKEDVDQILHFLNLGRI